MITKEKGFIYRTNRPLLAVFCLAALVLNLSQEISAAKIVIGIFASLSGIFRALGLAPPTRLRA